MTYKHKVIKPDINNLITDNLDVWTSAIKAKSRTGRGANKTYELYGIKKLRELILDLAVRGLLVPQDPNDEPASELLKKIAAEKEKLIKEGKIKKQKVLPPIKEDEKPFELHEGWAWKRFGEIVEIERGGSPRPIKSYLTDDPEGLNWIKIGDTDIGGKYITTTNEKIRKEGLKKTRMVYPGDFLLTNSMSFGRPYISKIHGCIHDGWLRISPPESLNKDYLYLFLSSPFIVNEFKKSAAGAVVMNLNADKVREVIFLLPPYDEQKRIVAKVDKLMALCDQLEHQTNASIKAHKLLVKNFLNALIQAKDHETFQQAWQRIAQTFDTLFTTEHSIDQLKQTILQLAVMGKLVPQNPNDEPASELLKKIAAEKEQLIKEGKIKKQKPLPEITEEEKPFELPVGWEYVRLGNLAIRTGSGSTPRGGKNAYVESGIPLLRSQNVRNTGLELLDVAYIPSEIHKKMSNTTVFPNDILLNITGGSLGRCTIFPDNIGEANVSQHVSVIRLFKQIIPEYMHICILSPYVQKMIWGRQVGMAREGLSKKVMEVFEIPTPPTLEQKRIVAKVDELMDLCDQLKSQITNSKKTQINIADTLSSVN